MPDTNLGSTQEAYRQIHKSSGILLESSSLSWIDSFLLKQVHSLAERKLKQSGATLSNNLPNDQVESDIVVVGAISGTSTVAIGQGARVEASAGPSAEQILRAEQYEIAKHWDGQCLMREFNLAGRDLSGLNLANADLRKATLIAADLSKANLVKTNLSQADLRLANLQGADLSEADLEGAKYIENTLWPDGFDPQKAGAILVDSKGKPSETSQEE